MRQKTIVWLLLLVLIGTSVSFGQTNLITITFDGNGAYLDQAGTVFLLEKTYDLSDLQADQFPQAYLGEEVFKGWYLDPLGEKPFTDHVDGATDLTLYAVFEQSRKVELPQGQNVQLSSEPVVEDNFVFDYTLLVGDIRYSTASLVSQTLYDKADTVVLASGTSFPDSLAAGPLARALGAPILLTDGVTLTVETTNELARLSAQNVWIIGGELAVSQEVEDQLIEQGYAIKRLTGASRYETSILVNQELIALGVKPDKAFITIGTNYPDALSIAGYAAMTQAPIVFSQANVIEEQALAFLEKAGISQVEIVGAVIQASVVEQLAERDIEVSRIAGATRYLTNQAVLNKYYPENQGVILAKGYDFPDSLVAAPLAAEKSAGIMLVEQDLNPCQKRYIKTFTGNNNYQVGGMGSFNPVTSLAKNAISILLDPGHGQNQNASPVYDGYYEGNEVFYLAKALQRYLQLNYDGVEVFTTRNLIQDNPSLDARGTMGNCFNLFLSLHTNAAPGRPYVRGSLVMDMGTQGALESNPNPAKPNPMLGSRLVNASANLMGNWSEGVNYRYWNMESGDTVWTASPDGIEGYHNYYGVLRHSQADSAMILEMGYHTNYEDAYFFKNNIEAMAKTLGDTLALHYNLKSK